MAPTPLHRPWTAAPEPASLLADCAAKPPVRKQRADRYAITTDHWSEYSRRDPRVARLWKLWEEAFHACEAAGIDAGPVLLMTPETAIAEAVAAAVEPVAFRSVARRRAA